MLRIKEAGDAALLLELEPVIDPVVNARAIAIAAVIRAEALPGLRDVVSTYRSVAVYFDPLLLDVTQLRELLQRASAARADTTPGRTIDVPVHYGGAAGPDLPVVAAFAGRSIDDVVARHVGVQYRVFMLGFLPGFAYLGTVPPEIAMPRRPTPRLRVSAGSVGIAGAQTAVYPRDSPGGWQIIGRTPLRVFAPEKTPAALFVPGDGVRFFSEPPALRTVQPAAAPPPPQITGPRIVTVLRPGLFTTVQDSGRWGQQTSGVPVSGAMDPVSHRIANAIVGNDRDAATLEVTLVGPELRLETDVTVAVAGADLHARRDETVLPLRTATRCRKGSVLRFGERRAGSRAYIAFDGGVAAPPVLGSRSTHAVAALGGFAGRPLAAGDSVMLGQTQHHSSRRPVDIDPFIPTAGVRLRVLPGPQDDFFPAEAFDSLLGHRFTVTAQSDRMGYRLQGVRIPRLPDLEMISDATFTGGIQVPGSGDPILLMADRQTTGGYPQIATVITADLPLAAQLAPGDWIEFQICSRRDALVALVAQEGKLLAVG